MVNARNALRKAHAFNIHLYLEMAQGHVYSLNRRYIYIYLVYVLQISFQQAIYRRHSIATKTNLFHLLGRQQRHKSDLSKPNSPLILIAFAPQCRSKRAEKLTVREMVVCVTKNCLLEAREIGM